MNPCKKILVCKVSYNWYQVIKSNFISSGSSYTNAWYTQLDEFDHDSEDNALPEPGSLMLFLVEKDGCQYIVGGGYFFQHSLLDIKDCWYSYGVRAGYLTFDAFMKRVEDCNEDMSQPLSCYIATGNFIFVRTQMVRIPDEFLFNLKNKSRFLIDTENPLGLYLEKVCNIRRLEISDYSSSDHTWPGIYYKASVNRSFDRTAQFKTELLNIYGYRCAVSGSCTVPALEVAHIKTIYDSRYVATDNGIILRSDLHNLFSKGLMTFVYVSDDKVVVKLSHKMKIDYNKEYSQYEGKELILPKEKKHWPNKEYLKWHNSIRFENWLKYGEFSLIDSVPMHPKKGLY